MAAFEVIALDTATPQLRAPGASDTYTFPRAVEMPLGTANGVLYLNGSKVVTSGSGLTFDSSGNLGLGVTPSAWGGSYVASLQMRLGGGIANNNPNDVHVFNNCYHNGTNWLYTATNSASRFEQFNGGHYWFTAPSGTAGNAISFTQAMTLDASGNLLVGVTTTSGSSSNGKFLTGGVFTTVNGATASTASGAAVTLFAAPSESTFMVTAYIFGAGAPASYNAVAIVKVSGGAATITTISSASNMTLSISGLNVQATQTSGASQSISYSAMRIV